MIRLSNDYIRDLQPELLRYDVTLDDDFVISVLPNGIKTWAFLYEYEGRQRRKTLGVYPEMSHEEAQTALQHARSMIERLGGDVDDKTVDEKVMTIEAPDAAANDQAHGPRPAVLAVGHRRGHIPHGPPKQHRLKALLRWLGYLIVVAAIGAGIAAAIKYWPFGLEFGSGPERAEAPASAPAKAPQARQPSASNPFASPENSKPDAGETPQDGTAPGAGATSLDTGKDQPVSNPFAQPAGDADSPDESTDGQPREPPPESSLPRPSTSTDPPPVVNATPSSAAPSPVAASSAPTRPRAQGNTSSDPAAGSGTRIVPATGAAPDTQPVSVEPPPQATARGGSVTRAVITTAVANLEPGDDLTDQTVVTDGNEINLFFFTELRNFTDGQVVHRWEHNGYLISDVSLKVATSWRWRTYSSKSIPPGMTGEWTVSVIDATGTVLASRAFRLSR